MTKVIITSTYPRHLTYVSEILKNNNVSHIFFEKKPQSDHEFSAAEIEYFGDIKFNEFVSSLNVPYTIVEHKKINTKKIKKVLKKINPYVILTFGCGLLEEKIIKTAELGIINIHTGLVQKHRGVDSCYWAIYCDHPEAIGCTLHFINKGIDSGHVLAQKRTSDLESGDNIYNVFMKTCNTGINLLCNNLYNIETKNLCGKVLKNKGKLFMSKHMDSKTFNTIRIMCPNTITRYLQYKNEYDSRTPLIC